jgi:nucleoside-diphosphate-sugar epimerase
MAKLRQEAVLREAAARAGFPLVVVWPGVIYGPRGGALSARVGLALPGVFLHLGGENPLPLTYVENCAEAVAVAAESPEATAQPVNVVDDDLPTCAAYLARYRREVARLRVVRLPWAGLLGLAALVERYHAASKGQLPAVLTPYKARALWGGNRFGNERLKALGWRQPVPTEEGLARTFAWLRARGQG